MMHSKFVKLGSLFLAGALASSGAAAHADNINTSATACNGYQTRVPYYTELGAGAFTGGPLTNTFKVVCPVPRAPLAPGANPLFYVDGWNFPSTGTTCTLHVYSFLGVLTQAVTFTEDGGSGPDFRFWDHPVSLPPNSVSPWDYVSLYCDIPDDFAGQIIGVTSVQ